MKTKKKIKRKRLTARKAGKTAIQKAIDFGIDITLLYKNLQLTPTERIKQNLNYIKFAKELKRAGERKRAKS